MRGGRSGVTCGFESSEGDGDGGGGGGGRGNVTIINWQTD